MPLLAWVGVAKSCAELRLDACGAESKRTEPRRGAATMERRLGPPPNGTATVPLRRIADSGGGKEGVSSDGPAISE